MSTSLNGDLRPATRRGLLWSGWLPITDQPRIELNLHLFFPVTLVAVTLLLALALLPTLFPGWQAAGYWLVAAAVAALDAVAGLVHELGHAVVAVLRGTGVSRITLYGLAAVRRSSVTTCSKDQVLIAMAGPLSHLVLAAALWAAWNMLPYDNEPLRVAVGFPALTNFVAGVFNLLPVSQLDGRRAARALRLAFARVGPPAVDALPRSG